MMQRKKKNSKQKDDANDNKNEQTLVASKYKFTYVMGFAFAKKQKTMQSIFSESNASYFLLSLLYFMIFYFDY